MNDIAGFWANVSRGEPQACWLWMAGRFNDGYGCVAWEGKARRAHRVAWQIANGPIAGAMLVCHRCDVALCCNPDHLFVGTQQDNMTDKVAKGRQAKGLGAPAHLYPERRPRGETHGHHTLTESIVLELRALKSRGGNLAEAARRFNIGCAAAYAAAAGRNWRHVP